MILDNHNRLYLYRYWEFDQSDPNGPFFVNDLEYQIHALALTAGLVW